MIIASKLFLYVSSNTNISPIPLKKYLWYGADCIICSNNSGSSPTGILHPGDIPVSVSIPTWACNTWLPLKHSTYFDLYEVTISLSVSIIFIPKSLATFEWPNLSSWLVAFNKWFTASARQTQPQWVKIIYKHIVFKETFHRIFRSV